MNTITATLLSALLLAGNVLLGYYLAPWEILLTPVVIVATTLLLLTARSSRPTPMLRTLLLAGLICGHDMGVKLYGGGSHDAEGQGFIHAFLLMGLLPAYGILVLKVSQLKGVVPGYLRVAACLLFPLLLALYLYFFGEVGYGLANECRYGC
ncbi:hypothetical protein HNQ93_002425 [Hymenobacter luteus]|uniref:Uncharacterized protein n=2 Tax=Hymenobacter TaxID=89966 RepID=A0A7W9T242_9BACT|nr:MULTISPECIES: hypothetical protein [Hymenobacter]MBB4602006.1 hypothetical protein [Hymenobacter latericoloratus]MBB6059565.1 hypothetical protein [Hymenobacter luteus]